MNSQSLVVQVGPVKQTYNKEHQPCTTVCAATTWLKCTYIQRLRGCIRETNNKVGVGSALLECGVGVLVVVIRSSGPQSEHLVLWKEVGSKLSRHIHQQLV